MCSRLSPEICGSKIVPPLFFIMTFLLSPEEKGCELVIGTYIFIFNVSKPPLFPVWLRELERGKKP